MNWIWWFVLPGALLLGLGLFALFGMFIASVSWEWTRETKLAELESRHHTQSQAETHVLVSYTNQARGKPAGSYDRAVLDASYDWFKAAHQDAWDARVKEIVELQCPVPDETFEALEAELRARGW